MWRSYERATHTLLSGKRYELEDFGIIEFQCAWMLRANQWQRNATRTFPGVWLQLSRDPAQNELFHRTLLARGSSFKFTINGVGNVYGRSHMFNSATPEWVLQHFSTTSPPASTVSAAPSKVTPQPAAIRASTRSPP